MHSSQLQSIQSDGVEIADREKRLRQLIQRCETFCRLQFERLEECYRDLEQQAVVSEPPDEQFRLEQEVWRRQRAEEETRIEDQLNQLTAAWAEVEAEQRRLLTQVPATTPVEAPTSRFATISVEDHVETHQAGSRPVNRAGSADLDLIDEPRRQSPGSAAIQFQKLKREIRQHTQRRR